jgi:protein-arginine kinase activator protein McsA
MNQEVKIGDRFNKQLQHNKTTLCEVVDIIDRISQSQNKHIGREYWAKSIDGKYHQGNAFEVAKTSVIRGRIEQASQIRNELQEFREKVNDWHKKAIDEQLNIQTTLKP